MTFAVHSGLGSGATAFTARAAGPQDERLAWPRSLAASASPSSRALSLSRAPVAPLSRKAPAPLRAQATEEAYLEQGSGEAETPAGVKLYVGNLPWNVDSGTLAEIFQEAGVVEEVEVREGGVYLRDLRRPFLSTHTH